MMIQRASQYQENLANILARLSQAEIREERALSPLGTCYYPRHCDYGEMLLVTVVFSDGKSSPGVQFHHSCYQQLLADHSQQRKHPLKLVS